jgi:thiol-disulfide isomerase/thioredoxin
MARVMKFNRQRVMLSAAALGLLLWTACNLAPAPSLIDPTALGAHSFNLMDGKPAKLSDYRGQVVVLDFWATYCPPCVAAMPDLEALHKQHGAAGLRILGLNVGGPEDRAAMPGFLRDNKIEISYTLGYPGDDNLVSFYMGQDSRIPQTLVYDRQGRLVKHFVGYNATIKKDLEAVIQTALK